MQCPAIPQCVYHPQDAADISGSWRSKLFYRGCSNLPRDSLQRAGSQCWRSSAKKRCCSSGWHTKGAHKHAILIPHSCSPSMEEMGKVRNCFCSYERKLVTTKLIVTPSFFFLQKFGGFHWKGKNWKMFGFWQSKTGNFLATNQNNLGFLVFGFGILPNSLAFHCQKLHIFQVFLTQWKPQNCCWNWTFPTENFWYYKEKKDIFGRKKMFWLNNFTQLCKHIPWKDHHIFTFTFSPQMAFLPPMGTQGLWPGSCPPHSQPSLG